MTLLPVDGGRLECVCTHAREHHNSCGSQVTELPIDGGAP